MNDLGNTILEYFQEKGWPLQQHETEPVYRFNYETKNASWACFIRINEHLKQIICVSVLPDKIPADKHMIMSEFITRANWGLNIGNFEFDFEDGELRYKTSLDVSKSDFTTGLLDPLIMANLVVMDDYLPGIKAILAGLQTPEDAVKSVRADIDKFDFRF
ncbi:YbjN domain-containing protein [Chitinophaga japonensis]|uniref:Putative sensory transduction regulator n=1 Tax=Chitinophaga japonensis TaxID=104662 RepID=A0A562T7C2_CHIJA|nr:YbjN domain-containing protein [Chitinophaga japonensis]TWI88956.1 putative sensory transduction regulator [Chitinophaga japonensis]